MNNKLYKHVTFSDLIKGRNNIKDVYINDLAIQYYVLKGSGLNIASSFLVHINNQYVRQGSLEIDKLFSIVDLTEEVVGNQIEVNGQLEDTSKVSQLKHDVAKLLTKLYKKN